MGPGPHPTSATVSGPQPPNFHDSGLPERLVRRGATLASDVLLLAASEAVYVLGNDKPLNLAAARTVPHGASLVGRHRYLRHESRQQSV